MHTQVTNDHVNKSRQRKIVPGKPAPITAMEAKLQTKVILSRPRFFYATELYIVDCLVAYVYFTIKVRDTQFAAF